MEKRKTGLSSFVLKIIACVTMTVDHVGFEFFPGVDVFRIIGRIAFPLFAFLLAEGSRYSAHPYRRLVTIAALGVAFETVYDLFTGGWYGNIFLTLTLSLVLITLGKEAKVALFEGEKVKGALLATAFVASGVGIYFFTTYALRVDYGFFGVLLPVLTSLCDFRGTNAPAMLGKFDCHLARVCLFAVGLVLLSFLGASMSVQPWCLLSLVFVALYNGERGKYKLKYLFYAYYPAHLLVIALISFLIYGTV